MKGKLGVVFMLLIVLMLTACSGDGQNSTNSEGNSNEGGETKTVLRAAMPGQPLTMDPVVTAASTTRYTSRLVYEQLYTLNSNYQPIPMLAQSYDVSEDGKTYTFTLREGVLFHNGEEMKSDDVVASLNRWIEISPIARSTFGDAKFESDGEYNVVVELAERASEVLDVIAAPKQFGGIMPKEVVEAAGSEGVTEYIGTGPFKFEEWKQDQYIKFAKFEDYKPVEGEADGLGGKKEALVDELYMDNVPDPSTRLSGLQTNQYDVSLAVPLDSYEQMDADPNVKTYKDLYGNLTLIYNKGEGIFTDVNMRKAANAAIDADEVLHAALTHEDLYEANHGYMHESQTNWYSEAGKEQYNLADPELAKEYLEKAGYDGEEIVLIATRENEYQYNAAIVTKEQLEKAGMKVRIDVYDFATLLEIEQDPNKWDLLTISFSTVTTPSQILYLTPNQHGFMENEKIDSLLDAIRTSSSDEESKELFDQLQDYGWNEYLPVTNYGFSYDLRASTNKVEGMTVLDGPILWNTKVFK